MKENKILNSFKVIIKIVIFSILMLGFMFMYSTGDLAGITYNIINTPIILVLNILPIVITTILTFLLLGRIKTSIIINFIFYTLLFLINRTKIIYRSDTIRVSDFRLGLEGLNMSTQGYSLDSLSIFLLILSISLLMLVFASKKVPVFRLIFRIPLLILVLALTYYLVPDLYKDDVIYSSIAVHGSSYNTVDNYNSRGTLYSLINSGYMTKINPPSTYSKEYYRQIDNSDNSQFIEDIKNTERPHIIWMMGEAYTELPQDEIFEFVEEDHPNKNLMELKEDSAFWGKLVTHSFAGGTGDTEFDALTGAMSKNYSPYLSYALNTIIKDTKSIATVFNDLGYETRAFHPGYEWFYRRSTVYENLGFQKSRFLEDIENPINKGDYLSQEQFTEILLEEFNEGLKGENPVFQYGVDIQNHGPYFFDKYGYTIPFDTTVAISEKSREILSSYFVGLKDIDDSLGFIYEEINKIDEPVIFIFYGDHLPGLGEGLEIYQELGYNINGDSFEDEMKSYQTPLLITGNEKGKELLKRENIELKDKQSISVNYLASVVFDLLGYTESDNFFSYISELRQDFRIISNNYIYKDETPIRFEDLDTQTKEEYDDYVGYQYYRIRELD